jgi:hypothetical protein
MLPSIENVSSPQKASNLHTMSEVLPGGVETDPTRALWSVQIVAQGGERRMNRHEEGAASTRLLTRRLS